MQNVFNKHQKAIAYKTLKMTPQMANIMGGMTFEEAYKIIFRIDLRNRIDEIIRKSFPVVRDSL